MLLATVMFQNQENLFICLAAILNMGNIEFGEDNNDHSFVKNKTGPLASVAVSKNFCTAATATGDRSLYRN